MTRNKPTMQIQRARLKEHGLSVCSSAVDLRLALWRGWQRDRRARTNHSRHDVYADTGTSAFWKLIGSIRAFSSTHFVRSMWDVIGLSLTLVLGPCVYLSRKLESLRTESFQHLCQLIQVTCWPRLFVANVRRTTRKRGNCECVATWGRPSHVSPFPLYLRQHARFEVTEPIECCIIAFLLLIHYFTLRCDLDLWPLTLNICSVSPVTWWNSVRNLNAIEQSAAELLRFQSLTLWPWTLRYVLR